MQRKTESHSNVSKLSFFLNISHNVTLCVVYTCSHTDVPSNDTHELAFFDVKLYYVVYKLQYMLGIYVNN